MLGACCKSLLSLLVVSQLVTKSVPLDSECLKERIEILPKTETVEEKGTEVIVRKVAWPWRRFVGELVDREDVLPESLVMILVCWMTWRLCCRRRRPKEERSPIHAIRKRESSSPEGVWWCISVTIPAGTTHDFFLWPINANTWIVLTPDGDKHAEKCGDYSRMRVPPFGEGQTPEIGSVEFSRGWTVDELSELVREGRNLALCARTSMGLTYDRDPTMMCDLSGRFIQRRSFDSG